MIILDTHALIWWMTEENKIPSQTLSRIQKADEKNEIFISACTSWEIALLVKKKRISFGMDVQEWLREVKSYPSIHVMPITSEIASDAVFLDDFPHDDPADRFIISTAITLQMPLVTKDKKIRSYKGIQTIWD